MAGERIMVVEDEGITSLMLQSSLKGMGYSVTAAVFTGEDAVRRAEEDKPDLVLMDIVLDGRIDGIEAAGQIHARFNIPVVYITAYSDDTILSRIKATEPFGYIIKPIDERELRMVIEVALYKHKMDRKLKESERELKKHREQLARIVEERTADLHSSTELLKDEINDRRLAEAEALRASHLAALGELAAGVAHEINNPINGIINYAQLLLNKFRRGSKEEDIAHRIIRESDRIAGIVQNLLSFARESKAEKRNVRINDVLFNSLDLIDTQLKKDGITLKTNVPLKLPGIIAQPQQLEQVFLNVISNARYALNQKYTGADRNKVLEIDCNKMTVKKKQYLRISFHDKGTGIPDGIIHKVMNPFFSTKPGDDGTGLGLSISHSIIKDHQGRFEIDSAEGEYTRVLIDLPVRQQKEISSS